jgi:hypothetical protein
LPDVFVVGPAKTGTSALYEYFRAHPQVYTAPIKETNYMAFCDGHLPPLAGPGDWETIGAKSTVTFTDYLALYANRRDQPIAVDVSPSYMHYPWAAAKIAELCPDAKIVVVLRNPVECSFSMYSMLRRDNRESCRTFREALECIEKRRAARWDVRWDYLRPYLISDAVARYLELFSSSQLFIRRYERFKRQPEQFYSELCDFLNIEPLEVSRANRKVNAGATRRDIMRGRSGGRWLLRAMDVCGIFLPASWRRSIQRKVFDVPGLELSPDERRILVDYYRADILKLAGLLSWDLSEWLKS